MIVCQVQRQPFVDVVGPGWRVHLGKSDPGLNARSSAAESPEECDALTLRL